MDFLAESCLCGQTLLHLVARGNSIIAELMRLSSYVPPLFKLETKADDQKYGDVLPDFIYLKSPESYEKKIDSNPNLLELDEEIQEMHTVMVERIYSAFESIHRYVFDTNVFLEELNDGIYVQRTMEGVFAHKDGKQLMCEALYLYGVMLLVVDLLFPGDVRERILVSYLRHTGQKASSGTSIDDVCKLLRSTGNSSNPGSKKSPIENYFKRVEIDTEFVNLVVGYLRSDDLYHQVQTYPSPEHRTTALATQASMLYVCLFFTPSTLCSHTSRMREIVDKFFSDNWVISFYMGWTVNLLDAWDGYKAAKQALNNTLEVHSIRQKSNGMGLLLKSLLIKTNEIVADGSLSEKKVIDHSGKLLNILRECNVVLRWLVLHTSSVSALGGSQSRKIVAAKNQGLAEAQIPEIGIYELLLNTSILELSLSETYKKLIFEKETQWTKYREAANVQTLELAEAFTESRPLARVSKNDRLNRWFKDIAEQIIGLDLLNPVLSRQKIIRIIQAMSEVKEFHNLDHSAGVLQAVQEVVSKLKGMTKVSSISEDDLVTLALVSDLSYAWKLINEYTITMQNAIKEDPSQVARLRAAFLKLASGLELPLLRINQAKSPDMISVSAYYSGEIVNYVKKVLQIIPETMFSLLKQIVSLQTSMLDIPTRLDKDKVKEFAQLDKRYKMAELTQRVAVLAEGVSMMKSTLVGVVKIDPKKLLEEGVSRELVQQVALTLHQGLIFNSKGKGKGLKTQLEEVREKMQGFQASFEYIQDYINMYCLKIWQEEICRIINYNVEQECNQLLKKKNVEEESSYQSLAVPIPIFPPVDSDSVNFVGRLLREILKMTNPRTTIYVPELETWYDIKNHNETISRDILSDVLASIGVAGLAGINKLLAFLTVRELQETTSFLEHSFFRNSEVASLFEELKPKLEHSTTIDQPQRVFSSWVQRCGKLLTTLLDKLLFVGQMQILQTLAASKLSATCKLQSKLFASALETLNQSLMSDVKRHYTDPTRPYPDSEGVFTSELSQVLEWCGMVQPLDKIYITSKPLQSLAEVLLLVIASIVPKIYFSRNIGSLAGTRGTEGIDGPPLVAGIVTLLKQFHSDHVERLLRFLSKYAQLFSASGANTSASRAKDVPPETATTFYLIQEIATKMSISESALATFIPLHLMALQTE